jgi:hypothetical protein
MEVIMSLSRLLLGILVMSLAPNAPLDVFAQQGTQKESKPSAPKAEQPQTEEERVAWKELAMQTLGTIIPEIDKVEEIHDRIRLKVRATGLLWKQDEPLARLRFRQILASIDQHQPEGKTPQEIGWLKDQLRQTVIQEVLRHDRPFADELAKSQAEKVEETKRDETGKPASDPGASLKERADRADRLATLAMQTFSEDPERALKLAEDSLAEGVVSPQLFTLLIQSRMSLGATRANPLFERIMPLLLQNPYLSAPQLQLVAIYIFPDLQLGNMPSESTTAPVVASPLIQAFFDLALGVLTRATRLIENTPPSARTEQWQQMSMHAYFLTRQLQPKFEQYGTTDAVATLSSLVNQLSKHLTQEQRQMVEANANPQANVGNVLNLAEREQEPNRRDAYFAQAAMSAYGSGDYINALKIAERIINPEVRQQIQDQIKQLLVQVLAGREEFDAAAKYARELHQPFQRAWGLFWVARALAKKEDLLRCIPLLSEAEQTTTKLDDSVEKAQLMLWITEVYVQIESLRSFELLSQTVKSINGAYDKEGLPKFTLNLPGGQNRPPARKGPVTEGWNIEPLFQKLARKEFPRALSITLEFSRLEFRLLAQLAVCQAVLTPSQEERKSEQASILAPWGRTRTRVI